MKMYLKFNFNALYKKVLEEKLREKGLKYQLLNFGEIEFFESLTPDQKQIFQKELEEYGIEIVENQKTILVQKIKNIIEDIIFASGKVPLKTSTYLSEKLNHSYGYLSSLFSEVTYTSIENFIIIQKIEYVKNLLITQKYNLTEIALQLNYSSVSHLSSQFKNITGITPSQFKKIIRRKKRNKNSYSKNTLCLKNISTLL